MSVYIVAELFPHYLYNGTGIECTNDKPSTWYRIVLFCDKGNLQYYLVLTLGNGMQ